MLPPDTVGLVKSAEKSGCRFRIGVRCGPFRKETRCEVPQKRPDRTVESRSPVRQKRRTESLLTPLKHVRRVGTDFANICILKKTNRQLKNRFQDELHEVSPEKQSGETGGHEENSQQDQRCLHKVIWESRKPPIQYCCGSRRGRSSGLASLHPPSGVLRCDGFTYQHCLLTRVPKPLQKPL